MKDTFVSFYTTNLVFLQNPTITQHGIYPKVQEAIFLQAVKRNSQFAS